MFYVLKQKYALNLIKTSFFAFFISIYKKMRKQQNFRYPCNVGTVVKFRHYESIGRLSL